MTSLSEIPARKSVSPSKPVVGPTIAVIPAYNEARFIGSLVLSARAYVDRVIVVDDGSTDRTADIAAKAGATVIRHRCNQGKAAAINTAFEHLRQLRASAFVMLDGDGQHFTEDIPKVLAPICSGEADIVIGSRFLEVKSDIPTYRQVGQHGLTLITNLASGVRISDSQSGYRAFSGRALAHLVFSQAGFSIESEMQFLVREYHLRVIEVPIQVTYAEHAKRNPIKHGMQVVNGILQLVGQLRPLLFFGLTGLLTLLLGTLLGLYVVDSYAKHHTLAVGLALVTVMSAIIGMLLFFAGVILHSIRGMLVELRRTTIDRFMGGGEPRDVILIEQAEEELATEPDIHEFRPLLERSIGS